MSYQKGDAKICDEGVCDSRTENYDTLLNAVVLPHSCDSWVIGNAENVRQMIADLEELLQNLHEQGERGGK